MPTRYRIHRGPHPLRHQAVLASIAASSPIRSLMRRPSNARPSANNRTNLGGPPRCRSRARQPSPSPARGGNPRDALGIHRTRLRLTRAIASATPSQPRQPPDGSARTACGTPNHGSRPVRGGPYAAARRKRPIVASSDGARDVAGTCQPRCRSASQTGPSTGSRRHHQPSGPSGTPACDTHPRPRLIASRENRMSTSVRAFGCLDPAAMTSSTRSRERSALTQSASGSRPASPRSRWDARLCWLTSVDQAAMASDSGGCSRSGGPRSTRDHSARHRATQPATRAA
jgi:hypothetical protein